MPDGVPSINNHAAFIWSVADLLRGDYKQSEYGRVILPFTVLRRLDCVLAPVKGEMLATHKAVNGRLANFGPGSSSSVGRSKRQAIQEGSVSDDGAVHGLEGDYATFSKRGERGDHDLWGQHLKNLLDRLGKYAATLVDWDFFHLDGKDVARVCVDPSDHPVYDTKGDRQFFWWRSPVSTDAVNDEHDRDRIIARRWG